MSTDSLSTRHELSTYTIRQDLLDLDMVHCGSEICAPGHSFGPAVRDHWLIHFILEGSGVFVAEEQTHSLHAGDGFLICPNQITQYIADKETPWHYAWVGFQGARASSWLQQAGLTALNPVFSAAGNRVRYCFEEMVGTQNMKKGRELRQLGLLHLFLSELVESAPSSPAEKNSNTRKEAYVRQALDIFRMHYARPLRIASVAAQLGLDRSYFSEIFRVTIGQAPRDFLLCLRMEKATRFLENQSLTIGDVARSVGYEDPLLFSKLFRKTWGISPRQFRSKQPPTAVQEASD